MAYNPWPLGCIPKEFYRPELDELRENGYKINDARDAITLFEQKIARFAGAEHAIAVDCCTHALFLSLKYLQSIMDCGRFLDRLSIPKRTYLSVPMAAKQAGFEVEFRDENWTGEYSLDPLYIIDSAGRFTQNMHKPGTIQCLSFQIKKRLPIGRGGMILTNDPRAEKWLRKASYDGRDLSVAYDEDIPSTMGWHFYMTPEDAARGLILFDMLTDDNKILDFPDVMNYSNYTDLSKYEIFK